MLVHVREWLKERSGTPPALIAATDHQNTNSLASDGRVHELLWLGAVSVKQSAGAMWAA